MKANHLCICLNCFHHKGRLYSSDWKITYENHIILIIFILFTYEITYYLEYGTFVEEVYFVGTAFKSISKSFVG